MSESGGGEVEVGLGAPRTFVGLVQYRNAAKLDVWKVKDQGKGFHVGPKFVEEGAEGGGSEQGGVEAARASGQDEFEDEGDEYDTEDVPYEPYVHIEVPEVDEGWVTPVLRKKASRRNGSFAGARFVVGIASLVGGVAVLLGGRRENKGGGAEAPATPKKLASAQGSEEGMGPPSGFEASERYGPAMDALRLAVEGQDWESAKDNLVRLDGELEMLSADGRRRVAEFEDVARRRRALEDEVAHMARLVVSLEAERDRLTQERQRADDAEGREGRIKENLEKMEGMLAQAEQRMTELIEENTKLDDIRTGQSHEIDELKIELEAARAEVGGKVQECAEMRAELASLRKELTETRAELEDSEAFVVRKANAVEKLVGDIDACHAIIADLKRQVNLQAGAENAATPAEGSDQGGDQGAAAEGQQQYSARFI